MGLTQLAETLADSKKIPDSKALGLMTLPW